MFGLIPFDRRRNQMQNNEDRIYDMDRLFENFFNDAVFPSYYNRSGLMRVDIRETEDAFLLEAELPGIDKDQVNIDLENNRLSISVNQEDKADEKNERFVRHERRACSMTRSFAIDNIDEDKITAKMDNGVLKLSLPKKNPEKPQNRKIDIG